MVFFSPVNPELGTIPSRQINHSNFEYLDIPGKDLNVNKFPEQIISFQEKKLIFGHMRIINLFPSR